MKKLIRAYFKTLSAIAPSIAAKQSFELFQVPMNNKIRKKELNFYSENKPFQIDHALEPIDVYEIGPSDGHLVFMIHGWESNAASLSYICEKLATKGFRTVAFNLPAHGHSKLKKSNIKICKEVLHKVISFYNPTQPVSFVSHSFGSLVTSYALSKLDLKVSQFIMLTAPNHATEVFEFYRDLIGLNNRAFDFLVKRASNLLKEPLSEVSVENFGAKINYDRLTIIQDENDKIVSVKDARRVSNVWDNSELLLIKNTGHYRMLWDSQVADMVLNQLVKSSIPTQEEVSVL